MSDAELVHPGEAFQKLFTDLSDQAFGKRLLKTRRKISVRKVFHSNVQNTLRLEPSMQMHKKDVVLITK